MPSEACSVKKQILAVVQGAISGPLSSVVLLGAKECTGTCGQAPGSSSSTLPGGATVTKKSSLADLSGVTGVDVLVSDKYLTREELIGKDGLNGAGLDTFLLAALQSLREGGVLVVREDLAEVQGGDARQSIPSLTDYVDVFRRDVDGQFVGFDFYVAEQIENSIHSTQNWLDFFWVLRKKVFPKPEGNATTVTFRDFLDKTQYTNTGIGAYEWMFGKDFISPGGYDENMRILKYFPTLKHGRNMLDIGSGIGGGVRQAAAVFGVHVTGIDLSSNMLSEAIVRVHKERDSRVKYAICDVLEYAFPEKSFDYVFSRDCIQHIPDTERLLRNIYNSLRPGGVVVITMYGKGAGAWTEHFSEYVKQRAYFLKTLPEIKAFAEKVGFTDVYTENMTPRFKEILESERAHLEKEKEDFFKHYTQKEHDSLINGWSSKLKYIEADNHNWNIFRAVRPL